MDGIQVITRAAAILRALKDGQAGLSLGQIAEKVGLPRSTVQRIVAALVSERLLMTSGRNAGVRLGPELQTLAEAARLATVDECRSHLLRLAAQTGETVDLSVLRGGQMVFVDQVQGTQRLRAISSVGEHFPLTTTACGRAVLALLTEAEAQDLVRAEAADWPAVRRMLEITRANGVALDLDDHTEGISAIGIAFIDRGGDLYAISVPIPTPRFADQRSGVTEALLRLLAELS